MFIHNTKILLLSLFLFTALATKLTLASKVKSDIKLKALIKQVYTEDI